MFKRLLRRLVPITSYIGVSLLLALSLLVPLTTINHQTAKAITSPAYRYTKTFDTTSGSANGSSVMADASGNVYLAGQFTGTVVFDGTGGSDSQTDAGGNGGAFLTKYNANGSYAYTKTFDTTNGSAAGSSVMADASGNVYIAGNFRAP